MHAYVQVFMKRVIDKGIYIKKFKQKTREEISLTNINENTLNKTLGMFFFIKEPKKTKSQKLPCKKINANLK